MSCVTIACQGFIDCPVKLNCPTPKCNVPYKSPRDFPPQETERSVNFYNIGSGVRTTVLESSSNSEKYMYLPQVQVTHQGLANEFYLFQLNNTPTLQEFKLTKNTTVQTGNTSTVLIVFQSTSDGVWYCFYSDLLDNFPGTQAPGRPGMRAVPITSIANLNKIPIQYAFNLLPVFDPTDNEDLLLGRPIAFQSAAINYQPGTNLPEIDGPGIMIKGVDLINGVSFCENGFPPLLAFSANSIRKTPDNFIGTGTAATSPPFCDVATCSGECNSAFFQVTQADGCLPILEDTGLSDEENTNFAYVIGFSVLAAVLFIIVAIVINVIVERKSTKKTLRFNPVNNTNPLREI